MMKPNPFALIVAAAAVTLTAVSVHAAPRGMDFSTLDLDANGELTLEEMRAAGDAHFDAADTNGDGELSAEEIATRARAQADERAARMIDRMDRDGNGTLSRAELTPRRDPARMFERVDTDGSGTITQAEFDAARDRMRERMGNRRHDR